MTCSFRGGESFYCGLLRRETRNLAEVRKTSGTMTRFKLRLCRVGGEWLKITRRGKREVTSKYRETASSCCVLRLPPLAPPTSSSKDLSKLRSFPTISPSRFAYLSCETTSSLLFIVSLRVFETRGSRRSKDR